MKNILHVVNISFVIPYFLGDQLLYFTQKGYKEFIICSPSPELGRFSEKYNFEYKGIEILRKISVWKDLKAIYSTVKFISRHNIDIVTGHTPKGALVGMIAAFIMRIPVRIYFRHGLVYETTTGIKHSLLIFVDQLAAKFATKVVCVSPSVAIKSLEDKLNSPFKQLVLSKGTCNGIDTHRFSKGSINKDELEKLRQHLHLKSSDFVVGFTGRLVRDKGIIELVRAFQIMQYKYTNLKLLLVGMIEERDILPYDIIEEIKQNPNIVNTGYVHYKNIEFYYALMDIFVLASYREGFPTSVLEASAMELPIITTKVTGCIDSIIEEKTGLFVAHNSDEIARTIEMFYFDEDMRHIYGKRGRRFIVDNFDQNVIWNEIEKLYIV